MGELHGLLLLNLALSNWWWIGSQWMDLQRQELSRTLLEKVARHQFYEIGDIKVKRI